MDELRYSPGLYGALQCHKGRGRPKNTWKRDLEKEMWTARYKYSWRKMEAAAQDRDEMETSGSTGSDKA